MLVNIKLHGILRDYLPRAAKGETSLNLPDSATVSDIAAHLKIKQTISAVVNGTEAEMDYRLQNGDQVQLFRLIAGG